MTVIKNIVIAIIISMISSTFFGTVTKASSSSEPTKDMCGNCLELKSAFKKLKEFSEKNSTEEHGIFSFYEVEEYSYFLQLEDKYKRDYLHDLYFLKFLNDIKLIETSAPKNQHCLIIEAKNNTLFKSYSLTKLLRIAIEYRKFENSWRVSKVSYFPDKSIEASCGFMQDL